MKSFRDDMAVWTEADIAMYGLAVVLGLLPHGVSFPEAKHVFWTSNALGDVLQDILDTLGRIGAVDHDADGTSYRSNPAFVWKNVSARPGR
jgi:hypothetical protein